MKLEHPCCAYLFHVRKISEESSSFRRSNSSTGKRVGNFLERGRRKPYPFCFANNLEIVFTAASTSFSVTI